MSLVESLFPAAELAAMKHAVLTSDDHQQPAAKRRKIDGEDTIRSRNSVDSGYNSDSSSPASCTKSIFDTTEAASPASSTSSATDEDDFCSKIAEARARLYSNASSMSIPSPPAAAVVASEPEPATPPHAASPVSVETLADVSTTGSSGCNLDTFVRLGLAVTSHERNLLSALAPVPRAVTVYENAETHARKLQWLQRRKAAVACLQLQQLRKVQAQQAQKEQQEQQRRRASYAGFAISCCEDEEEEENDGVEEEGEKVAMEEGKDSAEGTMATRIMTTGQGGDERYNDKDDEDDGVDDQAPTTTEEQVPMANPVAFAPSLELFDDFFNIEAACGDDEEQKVRSEALS